MVSRPDSMNHKYYKQFFFFLSESKTNCMLDSVNRGAKSPDNSNLFSRNCILGITCQFAWSVCGCSSYV